MIIIITIISVVHINFIIIYIFSISCRFVFGHIVYNLIMGNTQSMQFLCRTLFTIFVADIFGTMSIGIETTKFPSIISIDLKKSKKENRLINRLELKKIFIILIYPELFLNK